MFSDFMTKARVIISGLVVSHKTLILAFSIVFTTELHAEQQLNKITLNDDNVLLMGVLLNKVPIVNSLDGYLSHGQLLLAVEPLFDTLQLRYRLYDEKLIVWKDDISIATFQPLKNATSATRSFQVSFTSGVIVFSACVVVIPSINLPTNTKLPLIFVQRSAMPMSRL